MTGLLTAITAKIDDVLACVQRTGDTLRMLAARAGSGGDTLTRDDLAPLRALAGATLTAHDGFVAGAGAVLAPGVLSDAPRWIEWWWGGSRRGQEPERLRVDLDPASAEFTDYTSMEWYRKPERSGRWTITGPYVDYICTHEYTFTLALPVRCGSLFVGVAGADILATQVERLVLPDLASLGGDAVLTSASGRVIASNTVRFLPGEIAPPGEPVEASEGTLPWRLLLIPRVRTPAP